MKRVGFLFEKAFSKENLYQAYLDASKSKHGKRYCFEFSRRLGYNLDRLYLTLHDGSYQPQPYFSFMVYEPKPRQIYAPAFADLVVQHAIYRTVYNLFNRSFIDQSFACRKGMGTHQAADYAQAALQQSQPESYVLKLDIRKFFYRINRAILRAMIERKIKDKRFVDAMMLFADHGEPVGIPIGNLLSQLYALIYLNRLDHFIKRDLKARRYCRYVDDFVVFGISRNSAVQLMARIVGYLTTIGLELSKHTIAAVKRGINFVGYRTWRAKRFVRKRSLYTMRKAIKTGKLQSAMAILGHARRTHSLRYLIKTLQEAYHDLLLPKAYRQYSHC